MAEPTLALHKALLAALDSACSCPVWDAVPDSAAYPYVVIDYGTNFNADFLVERMDSRTVFISIWSRATGQAEVMGIMAEIDALNEQPLTLETGAVASLRVIRKRTDRQADNLTTMGQIALRIITTH
jgi:hypothetical protein